MKPLRFAVFLFAALLVAVSAAQTSPYVGNWFGRISFGSIALRLGIVIEEQPNKTLKGTLISLDQGNAKIPFAKLTANEGRLKGEIPAIGLTLDAAIDNDQLKGTITQGGQTFPAAFDRVKEMPSVRRPQEPKPPFPYRSEEVSVPSKATGIKLAGTLTLPAGEGPFPAVVMITGSGPQDRDEEILGHRPFLVIADALTRRGIAVLRMDDRGVSRSTGTFAGATSYDFAQDIEGGIEFLKSRSDIRATQIGLIGHSEGGLIAPIVASRNPGVAFIVLLAGTGVKGDAILRRQSDLIAAVSGVPAEERRISVQLLDAMIKSALRSEPFEVAEPKLKQLEARLRRGKAATSTADSAALKQAYAQFTDPWMRTFLSLDPTVYLRRVKVPVLALVGEKDLQVDPQQNLPPIQRALRSAGNTRVKAMILPGLNHLFQNSKTGNPSEYGEIEETFDPKTLKIIEDWILSVTRG